MIPSVLSYARHESLATVAFWYDHALSNTDLAKTPATYRCMYCGCAVEYTEPRPNTHLFVCDECGWWQIVRGSGGWGWRDCETTRGILEEYPLDALDVPLSELREYLKRHPDDVAHTNPTAFEHLMAACLRDLEPGAEVIHVGGSGDGGVDLILVRLTEGPRLVQVKRRSDLTATEGVAVVRSLNGVLFREGMTRGMVITTAARYSEAARRETTVWTKTREVYDMELLSFGDVVDLLGLRTNERLAPWGAHLDL